MAQFNPSVPQTYDPNYLNLSKSITTPEADKSTGIALQSAGNMIEGGIKATDQVLKEQITGEAQEGAQKIQTQQIGGLLLANAITSPQSNSEDLVPGDGTAAANTPTDVSSVKRSVNSLVNARDNGHISPTYYYMRLDSLAQNLRARYPGYRDYIDRAISEVTGVKPANALIQSLMQDLNASQENQRAFYNKVQGDLLEETTKGNPAAREELKLFRQTGDVNHAIDQLNTWHARDYRLSQAEQNVKAHTADETSRRAAAQQTFDLTMSDMFDKHWSGIQAGMGLNQPAHIAQLVQKAAAGTIEPLPPEQKEGLLGQMVASRAQMEMDMRAKLTKNFTYTTTDLDGNTVTRTGTLGTILGGPSVTEPLLQQRLKDWDTVQDLVTNEKYGLYTATKRMNAAILDQAQNGLLTDKTLGPWLKNLDAITKISPQYAEKYFAQLLASNIDQGVKDYIVKQASNMLAQPDYAHLGIANTLKKAVEDAKNKGIQMPQVYSEYVKALEPIWNTKPPAGVTPQQYHDIRANLAIAAFHPDNVGVLKQVQDDYWDDKGQHPGAQTIYQRFGQPDAVNNMKSLTDPVHWQNYVSFMGSEYQHMAQKDILNLNDLTKNFPNVFYSSWDPDRHQWRLHQVGDTTGRDILYDKNFTPNKQQLGMAGLDAQFKQVQQSMKRLNMITKPLVNIAQADGSTSPDSAVIQQMINAGLKIDPNKPPQGLPDQLLHSVLEHQQQGTPAKGWWDKPGEGAENMPAVAPLQYSAEGNPNLGDLQDFLNNPGQAKKNFMERRRDLNDREPRKAPAVKPGTPEMDPGGQGRDVRISNQGGFGQILSTGQPINVPNERTPETERMMRGHLPPQ